MLVYSLDCKMLLGDEIKMLGACFLRDDQVKNKKIFFFYTIL